MSVSSATWILMGVCIFLAVVLLSLGLYNVSTHWQSYKKFWDEIFEELLDIAYETFPLQSEAVQVSPLSVFEPYAMEASYY